MTTKLYVVSTPWMKTEPCLFEATVVRETNRFYIIEGDNDTYAVFGYKHRIDKDAARLTPAAAWEHYVAQQRERVDKLTAQLNMETARLHNALREAAACAHTVAIEA